MAYSKVCMSQAELIPACIVVLPRKTPLVTLGDATAFLLLDPQGYLLKPLDCGSRPGGRQGSTIDSLVILGKAVYITALCFLNRK